MGERKTAYKYLIGRLALKRTLEEIGVERKRLLELILKEKGVRLNAGLIWLRTLSSSGSY
jgi:hypothetical protein